MEYMNTNDRDRYRYRDQINLINKYSDLKNNKKKLNEEEENEIIDLLVTCRRNIEKTNTEIKENAEMKDEEHPAIIYVKILKLLIFFIPYNTSVQKKITERKIYTILFTRKHWEKTKNKKQDRQSGEIEKSELLKVYDKNEEFVKGKERNNDKWEEIENYEIIFLINLITHNEQNSEILQFLYKDYLIFIILKKHNKDNIFMLLNNFILNENTYKFLCEQKNLSFLIFLSVFDSLKAIIDSTNICNYFYIFIENTLKHENRLFLHIFENLQALYENFEEYMKEVENKFPILVSSHNWKILSTKRKNKKYLFKYITLMFRLLVEVLYNILDEKDIEKEQVKKYRMLYTFILKEIKRNLMYICEITYFDNFQDNQIDLYSKNLLFMDIFTFYTKQWNLEIFKLFLFILNIFNEYFKELENWNSQEKKDFINIILAYLNNLLKMRNQHILKKENMLYHNFIYNRYIISIMANFSFDPDVSHHIQQKNGINLLTKFMYIDDKDPYLSEYSVLAIKNIKENEIHDVR